MRYKLNLKREQLEDSIGKFFKVEVFKDYYSGGIRQITVPPILSLEVDSSQLEELKCGHKEVQCLDCASVLNEGAVKWP